jgi:hypothetical protein
MTSSSDLRDVTLNGADSSGSGRVPIFNTTSGMSRSTDVLVRTLLVNMYKEFKSPFKKEPKVTSSPHCSESDLRS